MPGDAGDGGDAGWGTLSGRARVVGVTTLVCGPGTTTGTVPRPGRLTKVCMNPLYWLPLPLAVTVVAMAVMSWQHRTRPPLDIYHSQEAFARFRAAMEGRSRRR